MKQLYIIVIILIGIALPFLYSFFLGNFTAAAIGIVLIGAAINIVMFDQDVESRSILYMWIAIIIITAVLLGLQSLLPKISFQ
jgi:hypothetical protein